MQVQAVKTDYDITVIGSGLGGLTAANRLAAAGYRVFLAEQHTQLGGLATFFRRKQHVFDVALHGFPAGMKKSFRKYWGKAFSDRIVQVYDIRFDNPQFRFSTCFDTTDFMRILREVFHAPEQAAQAFFAALNDSRQYDDPKMTVADFLSRFFPGRQDIWRFLMEPITYANGSTMAEPAATYAIVFGNFMNKGVFTFAGGTDCMLRMMQETLQVNGVVCATRCPVERILVERGQVRGVIADGRTVSCQAVISNASLPGTVYDLVGRECFQDEFVAAFDRSVRLSNSSCQVYIGLAPRALLQPVGDLIFNSEWPEFDTDAMCSRDITSRTFSVYYPGLRPGSEDTTVVASMNANYTDWKRLDRTHYRQEKERLIDNTLTALAAYVPNIRDITDWTEAATPCTFERYTGHYQGASFGTKYEGLRMSAALPGQVAGLFHTGSVGIIMSGWLGAVNYGVIVANEVEKYVEGRSQ